MEVILGLRLASRLIQWKKILAFPDMKYGGTPSLLSTLHIKKEKVYEPS